MLNRIKKASIKKCRASKGFVALFMVMLFGLSAELFLVSALPKVWFQSQGLVETRATATARFAALSCVNIARTKILAGGPLPLVPTEPPVVGRYFAKDGDCEIESYAESAGLIAIQTSGTKNGRTVSLRAELRADNLEIILIEETD